MTSGESVTVAADRKRPRGIAAMLRSQMRNIAPFLTLICLFSFFAAASPSFATLDNLGNILTQISVTGIIGNALGYWFGKKSGPFLFHRKDNFFFKRRYLYQAKEFYDKHGGQAVVFARFLPIIRTFAPIVAGIVDMDRKKFMYYNVIGCLAWVFAMLFGGHYLQKFVLMKFNFDLTKHLEVIVIGIIVVTTFPVLLKLFFGKRKQYPEDPSQKL